RRSVWSTNPLYSESRTEFHRRDRDKGEVLGPNEDTRPATRPERDARPSDEPADGPADWRADCPASWQIRGSLRGSTGTWGPNEPSLCRVSKRDTGLHFFSGRRRSLRVEFFERAAALLPPLPPLPPRLLRR